MDFEETLLVLRSDALIVAHSGNGVANVPTGRRISGIHLNRSEFLSGMALDDAKIRVGHLFELSCLSLVRRITLVSDVMDSMSHNTSSGSPSLLLLLISWWSVIMNWGIGGLIYTMSGSSLSWFWERTSNPTFERLE